MDDPIPSEDAWNAILCPQAMFAEHEGAPVGYAMPEIHKDVGYVRGLAVDAAQRRRGIGRKLMEAVAERLRLAGCKTWRLNVRVDNIPAQHLYESLGLTPAHRSTALRLRWNEVSSLPSPKQPLQAEIIQPSDDEGLEARFDLPPGQLAHHRRREGQILLRLGEPGSPGARTLGIASFAPSFPGAFPFRVVDSMVTRSLLEAMRPYTRPSDSQINLVIEGDDSTRALLLKAGAVARAELFHYRGNIPA